MTEYVCGFLISTVTNELLLIKKERPEWQKGLLNGIGGKLEPGEPPMQGMEREFQEEVQLDRSWHSDWYHFLTFSDDENYKVYFFRSYTSSNALHRARYRTDEKTHVCTYEFVTCSIKGIVVENLRWIVPLAFQSEKYHPITVVSAPGVRG